MWQQLFSGKGFYLGSLFERAAAKHGAVTVTLDRPLGVAPDAGTAHTYVTLADLVEELAARFWAAGVRPTERVAVHKSDNADIILVACALSRIGAVPALLSSTLSGSVVRQLLGRLRDPWLVTDAATLAGSLAGANLAEVTGRVMTVDGAAVDPSATLSLDQFVGARPAPAVRLHPREPALITHSSGTTGLPKLAVHCPEALWNRLIPQKLMALPVRGETAAFCMSFVHSRFYHALGVFADYGSPLLLMVDPDPATAGPLLAAARPGVVETHPNTFVLWEELAAAPGAPLANVRCYGSTFDAIHPRTVQRLLGASRRRGAWLTQLYGQSETGPVAARWYSRRGADKTNGRLVGVGLPGFTKVRVVDDAGRPCAPGATGHIEALTRGRILTYFGAEEQYTQQLDGDWWRMGDMGFRNRWGALHLVDREIDQIDSVHSNLEIEDVLMSRLAELREVVIVRGDDGQPVPVVCTRDDHTLDGVRWDAAVADLPTMAPPHQLRFDDLPRTGTWKIKRVELIKQLATPAPVGG